MIIIIIILLFLLPLSASNAQEMIIPNETNFTSSTPFQGTNINDNDDDNNNITGLSLYEFFENFRNTQQQQEK